MKRVLLCVSSDVVTDQRVIRHCHCLINQGFNVHVIARKTASSLDLPDVPFRVTRFSMVFQKGPLFYLFFNLRLLGFLMIQPKSVLWANDLDTVFPCYLLKKMKRQRMVFDAHELFTEVPELENSRFKKKIWCWIERNVAIKADLLLTVNRSLAAQFRARYNKTFEVVRNVPVPIQVAAEVRREDLGISENVLICILQGSGLNQGRGLLETVQAFRFLDDVVLFVIGSGNALHEAKALCGELGLQDQIKFIPRLPYASMMAYTQISDVGLAFDTHPCLNFHLALPNKIFDYFQAGIAVLCGAQPEIKNLVQRYDCGYVMDQITPEIIAQQLKLMKDNPTELARMKNNSRNAASLETWEAEQAHLNAFIQKI